jgi:hypothetical protein
MLPLCRTAFRQDTRAAVILFPQRNRKQTRQAGGLRARTRSVAHVSFPIPHMAATQTFTRLQESRPPAKSGTGRRSTCGHRESAGRKRSSAGLPTSGATDLYNHTTTCRRQWRSGKGNVILFWRRRRLFTRDRGRGAIFISSASVKFSRPGPSCRISVRRERELRLLSDCGHPSPCSGCPFLPKGPRVDAWPPPNAPMHPCLNGQAQRNKKDMD